MRILGIVAVGAALMGCTASRLVAEEPSPLLRATQGVFYAWRLCAMGAARKYAPSVDSAEFIAKIATAGCTEERSLVTEGMVRLEWTAVQILDGMKRLEAIVTESAAREVLEVRSIPKS